MAFRSNDIIENQPSNTIYKITESVPNGYLRSNFSANILDGLDSLIVKFSNWSLSDPLDTIISYEWDFDGDGNFDALDENPEHLYFASITPYTVSLIVTNNSGTKDTLTRQDYISVNSSISSLEDIGQIGQRNYIFPNPVNGSFDVRGMKELKSVIIQDLNGKKIVELKKENNDFQFSIPPLPSGLYLFELQSEKSRFVQKVLISD